MDWARCWVLLDNGLGRTVFTTVTSTLCCGAVVWYCTKIKVPGYVLMLNRDRNISTQRCACTRGTSLGVFSAGRISLMAAAPLWAVRWTVLIGRACTVQTAWLTSQPGESGSAI